ncbi:polyamine ABC transporter substrate-binding protein [Jidongwangia harbinensis]|uniref:polyamine ABC transporter substrate-binding protein n=1 Tax=Jidongwangia harbinensis TaxID=2878561 RepID=UPI001CD982E3|nr:spermidine/putrescine ABC transporter substrate-binding protein [Jidongwangia harbinensis]MCA2215583.1 spermidine/putrescine ABC transporter substrate-binding protein [Jidongwangia harbinensis]
MRRPALSPEAAAVLRAHRVSRRSALGVAGLAALAGCGIPGSRQTEASCVSVDTSAADRSLVFANWPQYIDVDDDGRPTLAEFERRTGIRVTYTEDINDNDQFFGKVQNQLADCRPTGRDIVVVTDWLVGRLVELGWVQRLDPAALPNVTGNLLPSLRRRAVDPQGDRAVPWQGGLAGLAYNGRVTGEVRTVDELLTRPDLKGRVTLLSELRDTMGLLLQARGHDPGDFTELEFDDALGTLRRAVESGQIRRFTGNDYAPELQRGDIAACIGWSGDIIQLAAENPEIRFVAPESGVILYSDDMVVPNRAAHRANAERLMNYYYDPTVAAQVAAYVNYICPVEGAQAAMDKIDPELARNPLIFPTPGLLARAAEFMPLTQPENRLYNDLFQVAIGA